MDELKIGQRVKLVGTDVHQRTVVVDTKRVWFKKKYQVMYQLDNGKMNFISWLSRESLKKEN